MSLRSNSGPPITATTGRRFWRSQIPALLALGGAALPKCPMCLLAIFGMAGLGASLPAGWLSGLTVASLALLLTVLAVGAVRRCALGPLIVGLAAAAAILGGKYRLHSSPAVYGGIGLLVAASIWNGWPRREKNGVHCAVCDTKDPGSLTGNPGIQLEDGL